MKHAIRKIDEAIKTLYNLEHSQNAVDFLVRQPAVPTQGKEVHGSLYLMPEGEDVSIGIYLHPIVREELSDFRRWNQDVWTESQRHAFVTATEEVSHFNYFLYHAEKGRAISQFELELQGEIDKFMLLFFSPNKKTSGQKFESLFETLFSKFRYAQGLTIEEKERYENAHIFGKKFILGIKKSLDTREGVLKAVEHLRKFYRLSSAEKVSFLHK